MIDKITKFLQISPAIVLVILGFILITKITDLSLLNMEVEELSQQTIYLDVKNQDGEDLSEYTVSIHPKYSFDNIHPKYETTRLSDGDVSLLISFSGDFVLRVNAQNHSEYRKELDVDTSRNLSVTLNSQKMDNNTQ